MKTRALALFALAAALGCRENLGTIVPAGLCAPPEDATACAMGAECTARITGRPFLDLSFLGQPNALVLWMQWNNQLLNNADETVGRVDTNFFVIDRYNLTFDTAALGATGTPIGIPDFNGAVTTFTVVPSEGNATSLVPIIPTEIAEYLTGALPATSTGPFLVNVTVKAVGRLGDDSYFETGAARIPVMVYNVDSGPHACTDATQIPVACPNFGQTASLGCATAL